MTLKHPVASGCLLFVSAFSSAAAQPTTFASRDQFLAALGSRAEVEDWTRYPAGTLLEGQTLRGVTYGSSSSETLVVGSPHGAGWLIGYARGDGRYASFSYETLSFSFVQPITSFGVALSQGNQSQGTRFTGSSTWVISVDRGTNVFQATATYTQNDFSGEAYFGVLGLGAADRVDVTQVRSDANIVWDIRDIAWANASVVPEPTATCMLLLGGVPLVGFMWVRRQRASRST